MAKDKQMTPEDFFAGMASKVKVLGEAAKTTPAGFLKDEELMSLFNLHESDKTIDFDFIKVAFGVDKNRKKFIRFGYVVTSEEYSGTQMSDMVTIDMSSDEAFLKCMKRVMVTLQKLGIDTREWEPNEVIANCTEAFKELNRSKPSGQMTLSIYTPPKKNPKDTPKSYLNKNIIRVFHEGPGAEDDDEESNVAGVESEEVDYLALAAEADNDDEDAQATLQAKSKELGLATKDFNNMSWEEVGQYIIDNSAEPEEEEEPEQPEVDDDDPATWVGLTATYDGEEVELKSYNVRKKTFEAYAADSDATYTVTADDLEW